MALNTFLTSTYRKALKEGVHSSILTKYEVKEGINKETGENKEMLILTFTLPAEDNRPITDVRSSEKAVAIMFSHLRKQLKKEEEDIIPQDFLNALIADKTEIKLYTVKTVEGYTNIAYLPPKETETADKETKNKAENKETAEPETEVKTEEVLY